MNAIACVAIGVAAFTFPPLVGKWNGVHDSHGEFRRWTTGGYLSLEYGQTKYGKRAEVCRRDGAFKLWSLRLDVNRDPR